MTIEWTIYKVTSPSGRAYIGLTKRPMRARWRTHCVDAAKGSASYLHRAMRKHGAERFVVEEITRCYSQKEAEVCERAMIASHGTFCRSGGYNMTLGGDGNWGWRPTKEMLRKMSEKGKLRAQDPELQRKLTEGKRRSTKVGKHERTAETRAKLSLINKGKTYSAEVRAKISAAGKGRVATPEARAKRRAWALETGYKPCRAAVERGIAARRGKPLSAEHRAKIAAAQVGRVYPKRTPEQRAALSAAKKAWLQTPAGQEYQTRLTAQARRIAKDNIGRKRTPEQRAVIAARNTARNKLGMSPESKAKRAATMARLLADPGYRAKMWTPERKIAHAAQLRRNAEHRRLLKALARVSASENKLFADSGFKYPLMEESNG